MRVHHKTRHMKTLALPLLLAAFTFVPSCAPPGTAEDTMAAQPNAPIAVAQGATLQLRAAVEHALVQQGSTDPIHVLLKTTALKDTARTERLPLNLAVVIDRSGSMEGQGKLEYVKQAFDLLVDNLDEGDLLTIVAYDSDVKVLRGADAGVLDKAEAKRSVRSLHPGSGTNLSGGMLQGYAEAMKNKRQRYVHRVLLLSDGLANEGITDPGELRNIANSKFEREGIALSTFGVGADFNEDLMTALADIGQGNYWYIDSPDKMAAIFQEELDGLLAVVAQNVVLTLDYPRELVEVKQVFGAEPTIQEGRITLRLNDAYSGEERNVVVSFTPRGSVTAPLAIAAHLEYDDVLNTHEHAQQDSALAVAPSNDANAIAASHNEEVTRRQVQFQANWNLEQALREADQGNYMAAQGYVDANRSYMASSFANVAADSTQQGLFRLNDSYAKELEDLGLKGEEEKKMIQKDSKSRAYKNRKGK